MKKDYIIFDFDNTLVHSLQYWHKVIDKQMFKLYGQKPNKQMKKLRAGSNPQIAQNFITLSGLNITIDDVFDGWHHFMKDFYTKKIKMIKGAKEFLLNLKKQGKTLILSSATQDRTIKEALAHFDLDLFDHIISEDTMGVSKRSVDFFARLLQKLGTTADKVLFFEDSYSSIKCARQNNIDCVALAHKFNKDHKNEFATDCLLVIKDYTDKRLKNLEF